MKQTSIDQASWIRNAFLDDVVKHVRSHVGSETLTCWCTTADLFTSGMWTFAPGRNALTSDTVAFHIQFSLFCIAQYHKLHIFLRGLYNLTHTTSLTFDLTSDQEQLRLKKTPLGEQQRRIPLQDGQNNRSHVTRRNHYRVTTHSMSMTVYE